MTGEVAVRTSGVELAGALDVPPRARGVVAFAHGSGSSRHSPRNRQVADALQSDGLATLLFDLLTAEEDEEDRRTRRPRFDIDLLSGRLVGAIDWLAAREGLSGLPLGLFGASTGAAAALRAAAGRPDAVGAVVSRGGRPDLAGEALTDVRAPTLLVVGGRDAQVLELNRRAADRLGADVDVDVAVVDGATHLFEEPGALEEVSRHAAGWFTRHLTRR